MTLQSNAFTAQADPTTARIILDEESYAGVTTLNTDLKAYASRDNGTTFTQMTLADQTTLDSKTILLLHCDGADSGTTFTDSSSSPKTITVAGNTHTDTTIKKLGTASAQFDGTGDYLSCPQLLSGNETWTVDCWVYRTELAATNRSIWGCGAGSSNGVNVGLNTNGTDGSIEVAIWGMDWLPSGTVALNTWTHLALVWNQTNLYWFIDGTLTDTNTLANPMNIGASDFQIGKYPWTTVPDWLGYIDEFRVSNSARWTTSFTPDTSPYTGTEADRRLLSGSVDISGQPAGSNVKYKIETLNQAATKQTRVYGTSMAWA